MVSVGASVTGSVSGRISHQTKQCGSRNAPNKSDSFVACSSPSGGRCRVGPSRTGGAAQSPVTAREGGAWRCSWPAGHPRYPGPAARAPSTIWFSAIFTMPAPKTALRGRFRAAFEEARILPPSLAPNPADVRRQRIGLLQALREAVQGVTAACDRDRRRDKAVIVQRIAGREERRTDCNVRQYQGSPVGLFHAVRTDVPEPHGKAAVLRFRDENQSAQLAGIDDLQRQPGSHVLAHPPEICVHAKQRGQFPVLHVAGGR